MSGKYGFTGGIELPKITPKPKKRQKIDRTTLKGAVREGNKLGFVSRENTSRLKPGPKRKEPQGQVSIPGPKRITDEFRNFCVHHDLTLWQGLELLLKQSKEE